MSLLRNTAVVGSMTSLSRILGFVRDMLIAGTLGTGPVADAFFMAFRFPNLFRRFFAEGAFNSAFLPLFSRQLEAGGKEAAKQFAEQALSMLLFALLALTLLAEIFMPAVIRVIAGGFVDDPEKFARTVYFTRITFPYLLFVSLLALMSGIMNSVGRFGLPALAPVLLNIILILSILFLAPHLPTVGDALVWGVAFAGWAQFIALVFGCANIGYLPGLPRPRLNPAMKKLIRLGVPGIIAGGIIQINLLIGAMIASFQEGAVAILQYADRVYQLPLGLIGVAMGVVLLPDLSRRLGAGDEGGAMWSLNRALELAMFLTLPAAVALAVIPGPVMMFLFQTMPHLVLGRSAFTAADTARAAPALMAFAIGLPAFVLIKVFQPGFFAREDTRTPMLYSAVNVALNIALSVFLFFRFDVAGTHVGLGLGLVGIPVATTIAAWVNTLLLGGQLVRLGLYRPDDRLRARLPGILAASAGMGLALWLGQDGLSRWLGGPAVLQIAAVAILILGGMAVYFGLAHVTGGARINDLKTALKRG